MIVLLYVLLGLLVLLALANLVLGRLPRRPEAGGGVVETSFGPIHYLETMGEGQAIVFIHGMPGTCREFDAMRAALPDRHTIAIDRPGYAWSEGKPQPFASQIDAVHETLTQLGVERATFVGHSFGGLVTLGMAIRKSELVDRMLLVAPAAGGTRVGPERMKQARWIQRLELPVVRQIADLLFLRLLRKYASQRGAELAYGGDTDVVHQRLIAESVLARHNSIRALANDRLLFNDAERLITSGLGRITARSIIVHGADDETVTLRNAERLAEALPNTELVVLEGAGHQLPTADTELTLEQLERVLAFDSGAQ